VFNKGSSKGFIVCIPKGGHSEPITISGLIALWKKAQNIDKKKIFQI